MNNINNTNGFSSAEYSGRTFFESILSNNDTITYQFTPTKYDKVDVIWVKDGVKNVGEIKYRINYASTSSTMSEGAMIEKSKYDALMSYYYKEGNIPYYINFFNDNVGVLFDLRNIDNIKWVEEKDKYPKTTMGDNKKVPKVVAYLKLDKGKKFKYIQKVD